MKKNGYERKRALFLRIVAVFCALLILVGFLLGALFL